MSIINITWDGDKFVANEPVDLPPGTKGTAVVSETPEENARILRMRFPKSFAILPHQDAEELRQLIREARRDQQALVEDAHAAP